MEGNAKDGIEKEMEERKEKEVKDHHNHVHGPTKRARKEN